jgi:CBS-domain-containing membrane protein
MMQHLKSVPASELARGARELVSIDTGTSIDDALAILKKKNILSLPVYDHFKGEWVGIVTIQDLLTYVAFKDFDESGAPSPSFANGIKPAGDVIRIRETQLPVADVADQVADLLEPLCKDVHRMLVRIPSTTDGGESEVRMVTQSDVLHHVLAHQSEFEIPNWNQTVDEAGMVRDTISMKTSESALGGFQRMAGADCNALPVVDDDGAVVATLSGADLRGLTSNLIQRVTLPVLEFLKETSRGIVRYPITVQKSVTVSDAAMKMMLARVHRVWVVDEAKKPVGVVSTSDVIKHLYRQLSA